MNARIALTPLMLAVNFRAAMSPLGSLSSFELHILNFQMTWVDLLVACLVNPIIYHRPKLLQDFPLLYLHNEKVAHHDDLVGFLYHVRTRKFQDKK